MGQRVNSKHTRIPWDFGTSWTLVGNAGQLSLINHSPFSHPLFCFTSSLCSFLYLLPPSLLIPTRSPLLLSLSLLTLHHSPSPLSPSLLPPPLPLLPPFTPLSLPSLLSPCSSYLSLLCYPLPPSSSLSSSSFLISLSFSPHSLLSLLHSSLSFTPLSLSFLPPSSAQSTRHSRGSHHATTSFTHTIDKHLSFRMMVWLVSYYEFFDKKVIKKPAC